MIGVEEFIESTISQIIDATEKLQEKYKDKDVIIFPNDVETSGAVLVTYPSGDKTRRLVTNIEMDLTLDVYKSQQKNSSGGINKIVVANIGRQGLFSTSSLHKVRFSMQIALPSKDVKEFFAKKEK